MILYFVKNILEKTSPELTKIYNYTLNHHAVLKNSQAFSEWCYVEDLIL